MNDTSCKKNGSITRRSGTVTFAFKTDDTDHSIQLIKKESRTQMSTLWIGNFSFDDQLQGNFNQPSHVRRFEAELAPCFAAAASAEDFVLCPEMVDEEYSERLIELGMAPPTFITAEQIPEIREKITHVQPWGWTLEIMKLCKQYELSKCPSPPLDVVKRANSRQFFFHLSRWLDCSLPGESKIQSMAELHRQLQQADFENGFVVKANFGQSGRGQIMRDRRTLTQQQIAWVIKRIKIDKTVFLEPKLKSLCEFGIQWDVPRDTYPTSFVITRLCSGDRGQFLGSTVDIDRDSSPEIELIIQSQRLAMYQIQQMGYFGPMGIDAMIYEDQTGERAYRSVQDINARWTMGRLAMSWANVCFPNAANVNWIHAETAPTADAIRTSPLVVGGQPVKHQTWCYR